MKKVKTEIEKFGYGELRNEPCAVAQVSAGDDMLLVVRPTRKAAILRANAMMAKLGWRPAGPWEEPS